MNKTTTAALIAAALIPLSASPAGADTPADPATPAPTPAAQTQADTTTPTVKPVTVPQGRISQTTISGIPNDATVTLPAGAPDWVMLKGHDLIVSPYRDTKTETYKLTLTVDYADKSTETVDATVTVATPLAVKYGTPQFYASIKSGTDRTVITPIVDGNPIPPNTITKAELVANPPVKGVSIDSSTAVLTVSDWQKSTSEPTSIPVRITFADGTTADINAVIDTVTLADQHTTMPAGMSLYPGERKTTPSNAPQGTTITADVPWIHSDKEGNITAAPGFDMRPAEHEVTVTFKYRDGSTKQHRMVVTVTPLADKHTPTVKPVSVTRGLSTAAITVGGVPDTAKLSVNELPEGVSVEKTATGMTVRANADAPAGNHTIKATITYTDGTTDNVDVPIEVLSDDARVFSPRVDTMTIRQGGDGTTKVIDAPKNHVAGYEITSGGEHVTVTPEGDIAAKLPDDMPTGTLNYLVKVIYGDGTTDDVKGEITVTQSNANSFDVTYPTSNTIIAGQTATIIPVHKPKEVTAVDVESATDGWRTTTNPATGAVTVTTPAEATDGDTGTIHLKITYQDGSSDHQDIDMSVVSSMAQDNTPSYPTTVIKPGRTVTVNQSGDSDLPAGTKITLHNSTIPFAWSARVTNPNTGELSVTAPPSVKVGETHTLKITYTYPDKSSKTVEAVIKPVKFDADGFDITYPPAKDVLPGDTATITPTVEGNAELPKDATFSINDKDVPKEWTAHIDSKGTVTLSRTLDAKDVSIPVRIEFPDKSTKTVTAHATVGTAPTLGLSYRAVDVEAGKQTKTTIEGVIPAGTTFSVDYNSIPKTWAATVDPKGTVTLTPPKDATGAHKIGIVAEHKGTKTFLEVPVTVTPAGTSSLQRGNAADNGKTAGADTQRDHTRTHDNINSADKSKDASSKPADKANTASVDKKDDAKATTGDADKTTDKQAEPEKSTIKETLAKTGAAGIQWLGGLLMVLIVALGGVYATIRRNKTMTGAGIAETSIGGEQTPPIEREDFTSMK